MNVRWGTDRETGDFKGYGHVEFANAEEGPKAAIQLMGQECCGRAMRIDFAADKRNNKNGGAGGRKSSPGKNGRAIVDRPLSERTPGSTKIFIGNLSWSVEDKNIYELFDDCKDDIQSIRWCTDRETGQFRGFGHVEFGSEASVDKAIAKQGTDLLGRPVRVDYSS